MSFDMKQKIAEEIVECRKQQLHLEKFLDDPNCSNIKKSMEEHIICIHRHIKWLQKLNRRRIMTEEQFTKASNLIYEIGLRENRIEAIDKNIKSLKEKEGHDCTCQIDCLTGGERIEFGLYPLTKKIIEVIVEHLNDRIEEDQKELKELKEKFKKL